MLKKLQRKFTAIAIIAVVVIVSILILFVNAVNIGQRDSDVRNILNLIAENDGMFPNPESDMSNPFNLLHPFKDLPITIETPYSTRYFVVKLLGDRITYISTENITAVTDDMAVKFASQVYGSEPGYGFVENYRYYYDVDAKTNAAVMVFVDFQRELEATYQLASISIYVGLICVILMIFPVYLLSKKALKPVAKSIAKQKQFITDAGHELKTPLAIISADAEVLEMCEGENEWLTSIRTQTVRLDQLVKDLVTLSKLDEDKAKPKFEHFNISDAVMDCALEFETLAKANGLKFTLNIAQGLTYNGSESEIRQLISILSDNAVKYCLPGGEIKLSLYKSGKSIVIEMTNDCNTLDDKKLARLFDRFYRADDSRSRDTGGYGIGLSIAQVIVERHKGKITAKAENPNKIKFKIVL